MNKYLLLLSLSLFLLTSCSWLENHDRREIYLEAKTIPRTKIPEDLAQPEFADALQIPELSASENVSKEKVTLGLPQALSTSYGVEQIVIKKLGDSKWIFLDEAPASVWPKIQQFFEEKNIKIQSSQASRGIIESEWLASMDGEVKEIYASIVSAEDGLGSLSTLQHKFKLTIEAGIRSGSSEVYLEQKQVFLNAPVRLDAINWTGKSDNLELEYEMLSKLAFYLGENINKSAVSIGASALRNKKAELISIANEPVLRYRLAFNRVWSTVGSALRDVGIPVEDLNRDAAIYYISFDDTNQKEESPGFIKRLFTREEKQILSVANRYLVHLETLKDEVLVTIKKDANTPANAIVAERLLKIIKESST